MIELFVRVEKPEDELSGVPHDEDDLVSSEKSTPRAVKDGDETSEQRAGASFDASESSDDGNNGGEAYDAAAAQVAEDDKCDDDVSDDVSDDILRDSSGSSDYSDDTSLDAEIYFAVNPSGKPPEITEVINDNGGDDVLIDDNGIRHNLSSYERWVERKRRREKNAPKRQKLLKAWRVICPLLVAVCSIALSVLIVYIAGKAVVRKFIMPVDPNDPTPIVVVIPSGSGSSAIAKILYEAGGEGESGLISYKAAFKVYADFKGKSGSLQAGTYVLSRNMDIAQIVDIICSGNPPRETTKFTTTEGMTVENIADRLVELGVLESPDRFLELCVTGEAFTDEYSFLSDVVVPRGQARPYLLEGYLFPDTYEIFVDANEETIIDKMLSRFAEVYTSAYAERAEELGYTMDEVVILASMIEKEAKTFDFAKVSAVFRNRLALGMTLGSDATLEYIFKTGGLSLTAEQLADPTPYNTHRYPGLPLGPISNPGLAAIEAVLYPDEQFITDGYLYFCLMDSSTGALIFARTLEEHNANVERYSPYW